MKRQTERKIREAGAMSTTIAAMIAMVMLAMVALLNKIVDVKKARSMETASDTDRRMNEAALQTVTQLVANGYIYFDPVVGKANEQATGLVGGEMNSDCSGSADSRGWRYDLDAAGRAVVTVCISTKNKSSLENVKVPFKVVFFDYKSTRISEVNRIFGYVKTRREGRKSNGSSFPTLDGEINFGAAVDANQGIATKHGGADVCYYMRPRTVGHGVFATETNDRDRKEYRGFMDRRGDDLLEEDLEDEDIACMNNPKCKKDYRFYRLWDLEPRPDGKSADQYGADFDWGELVYGDDDGEEKKSRIKNTFKRLTKFLTDEGKVFDTYAAGYRIGRPVFTNWGNDGLSPTQATVSELNPPAVTHVEYETKNAEGSYRQYFVGVMPKYGDEGPQFQYFLSSDEDNPTEWPACDRDDSRDVCRSRMRKLKSGCEDAGADKAKFCTRVDLPYRRHEIHLRRKCKAQPQSIGPILNVVTTETRTKFSSAAVNVSCDSQWVETVRGLFERSKKEDGKKKQRKSELKSELNFDQVISALEVDDDFLNRTGVWSDFKEEEYNTIYSAYQTAATRVAIEKRGAYIPASQLIKFEGPTNPSQHGSHEVCSGIGLLRTCSSVPCTHPTNPDAYNFVVSEYEDISDSLKPQLTHTSKVCSYFLYKKPTLVNKCHFNFKTELDEDWVCRTNDGCFDEGTMIRMADGSDRRLTDLRKGDLVHNPVTGKASRIARLVIGPENHPLIHVQVGGRVVKVTGSHPFMTRKGWAQARVLHKGIEILMPAGAFVPIEGIEIGQSGRTVGNLALEGAGENPDQHYVLADGVVTGDLVIQNLLDAKALNK